MEILTKELQWVGGQELILMLNLAYAKKDRKLTKKNC